MDMEAVGDLNEWEDGEISSDNCFDDVYIPLKRPDCVVPVTAKTEPADSDVDRCTSSTESDSSDGELGSSKMKKKIKMSSSQRPDQSKKKNCKIWCSVLEAEDVTSNLINCNLGEPKRYFRGFMPYGGNNRKFNNEGQHNFTETLNKRSDGYSMKRNHQGQYVNNKQVYKSRVVKNPKLKEGVPKDIPPLVASSAEVEEKLAEEIADKLNEEKMDLVLRAVQLAGKEAIISLFEETRKVEKSGGILIMNGSRRRSSGGVFFYLLKMSNEIPIKTVREIFELDKKNTNTKKKIIAKTMNQIRALRREELNKDDFPTLLSRTELVIKEYKERKKAEESAEMENPPPSPATDG